MAITIGNKTQANPTPGASFYQLAHNQNTGSDGLLIVSAVMSRANNDSNFFKVFWGLVSIY